jgi:hypothetical protein
MIGTTRLKSGLFEVRVQSPIDFVTNLKKLDSKIPINDINSNVERELFADRTIMIDAIFGSG